MRTFAKVPTRDWLRERREALGIQQWRLGEQVGLTQQQISLLEQGKRSPSVQTAKRLGEILSVEWEKFYNSSPAPPNGTEN